MVLVNVNGAALVVAAKIKEKLVKCVLVQENVTSQQPQVTDVMVLGK